MCIKLTEAFTPKARVIQFPALIYGSKLLAEILTTTNSVQEIKKNLLSQWLYNDLTVPVVANDFVKYLFTKL